jgi:hypothetical protein
LSSTAVDSHAKKKQIQQENMNQLVDHGCGGIFWEGMKATYPPTVPLEHVRIARLCLQRKLMFHGEIDELGSFTRSNHDRMMEFTAMQCLTRKLLVSYIFSVIRSIYQ